MAFSTRVIARFRRFQHQCRRGGRGSATLAAPLRAPAAAASVSAEQRSRSRATDGRRRSPGPHGGSGYSAAAPSAESSRRQPTRARSAKLGLGDLLVCHARAWCQQRTGRATRHKAVVSRATVLGNMLSHARTPEDTARNVFWRCGTRTLGARACTRRSVVVAN